MEEAIALLDTAMSNELIAILVTAFQQSVGLVILGVMLPEAHAA
jgi:hypothetical protein